MQGLYNHALVTGDTFIKRRRKIKKYKILPEKPSGYYLRQPDICGRIILDLTELENDTVGDAGSGFMVKSCEYDHGPSGPRTVNYKILNKNSAAWGWLE